MTFNITKQQRFIVTFILPDRADNLKKTEKATYYFDTEPEAQDFAKIFVEMNSNG